MCVCVCMGVCACVHVCVRVHICVLHVFSYAMGVSLHECVCVCVWGGGGMES